MEIPVHHHCRYDFFGRKALGGVDYNKVKKKGVCTRKRMYGMAKRRSGRTHLFLCQGVVVRRGVVKKECDASP